VLAIVAVAAMRTMRPRRVPAAATVRTRSRLAELGLPVGPLCGLDLVLGSGRRGRGVNQAAVVGTALAAMAGAGALVLTASTDHLFATPKTFGWTWDYTVPAEVAEHLVADPAVESVGIVQAGPLTIDGRATVTRGISSLKGELPLLLVDGRHAEPGEVVLGTRTMDDLGVDLGDTVVVDGSNLEDQELRVVGAAVFAGVIDVPEAGRGAAMPLEELTRLGLLGQEGDSSAVLTMAAGADHQAFARRIAEETGDAPEAVQQPVELTRLREIEAFPFLLAAFLTGIGLVAMAHAVVVTTRRRRSDMAVLRALGLARRGVYQAVSTQAVVLAFLGACIGVPLGIAAGQALWRGLARSLGLVGVVDVPWPLILGATALAAATLGVFALIPARGLVRTRPAVTLRSE
jgi:putative ABC transport system permease protein